MRDVIVQCHQRQTASHYDLCGSPSLVAADKYKQYIQFTAAVLNLW